MNANKSTSSETNRCHAGGGLLSRTDGGTPFGKISYSKSID